MHGTLYSIHLFVLYANPSSLLLPLTLHPSLSLSPFIPPSPSHPSSLPLPLTLHPSLSLSPFIPPSPSHPSSLPLPLKFHPSLSLSPFIPPSPSHPSSLPLPITLHPSLSLSPFIPPLPPFILSLSGTGFVGILFPTNSDPAYSIARMWLALGFVIGFIAANFGDVASRLYLLLAVVVVTVFLYLVVEIALYLQSKKSPPSPAGDEINLADVNENSKIDPVISGDTCMW